MNRECLIQYDLKTYKIVSIQYQNEEGEICNAKCPKSTGHIGFVLRELERINDIKLVNFDRVMIEVIR
jgi:hypothetical protein